MRTKISKLRSPLWRTAILAITSVLLVASGGCGHDSPDTDITPSTDTGGTSVCISTSMTGTTTTSSMTVTTLQMTSVTTTAETTTTVMTTMTSTPEMAISSITKIETESDFEYETSIPVSETERIALVNCVAHEYGSDWVSVYDKACVVATVVNRVYSSQFPDTVLEVLTQPGQFADSESYAYLGAYSYQVTDSCVEAVDYYFSNTDKFGSYLYFEGNGTVNIFY